MDEGNPRLRNMSMGKARSLCLIEVRKDPKAEAKYKAYCSDYEDAKQTYGAGFRGFEKGGRPGQSE